LLNTVTMLSKDHTATTSVSRMLGSWGGIPLRAYSLFVLSSVDEGPAMNLTSIL